MMQVAPVYLGFIAYESVNHLVIYKLKHPYLSS